MIIRILQDSSICAIYSDGTPPEVINSTHSEKAQASLVKSLADALPYKGAMEFEPNAPEVVIDAVAGIFKIGDRRVSPEDEAGAEPPEIQTALDVFYGPNRDSDYAKKWRAAQVGVGEGQDEPLTPEQEKESQRRQVIQQFDADIAALKSGYTENEVKSWDQKAREAKAVLSGAQEPTPMLDRICADRGLDKAVYAQEIAQKAALYADQYGAAESRMKNALAAL